MKDNVYWGVLGNATIARKCVMAAIKTSSNGILQALASRNPEQAAGTARQMAIPKLYDDYQQLLDDDTITAVYIPLPNHLHLPWALKAMSAGKHVLVEKPMACNARQAQTMATAARAAGVVLMEAFMYRFHPRSRIIKQRIAAGELGTLRFIRTAFSFSLAKELLQAGEAARLRPEMGGGALLDVGSYGVSVARWYTGTEPHSVQALAKYHQSGVDCHFAGILDFGDRCLATIEASFVSALQQTYCLIGDEGAIELPHNAFVPWEKDSEFTIRKKEDEDGAVYHVDGADEYRLMVEHFANAVIGEERLAYPPEESIANMRVLDSLAEAAKEGSRVYLKDAPALGKEQGGD